MSLEYRCLASSLSSLRSLSYPDRFEVRASRVDFYPTPSDVVQAVHLGTADRGIVVIGGATSGMCMTGATALSKKAVHLMDTIAVVKNRFVLAAKKGMFNP